MKTDYNYFLAQCSDYAYLEYSQLSTIFDKNYNDWKLSKMMYDPILDSQAFIIINESQKTVVLAFRGTQSLDNWYSNISNLTSYVGYKDASDDKKVGRGFFNAWKGLKDETTSGIIDAISQIKTLSKDIKFYITGHSLGASIAVFATTYFAERKASNKPEFNNVATLSTYTYATPNVGNAKFAEYYEKLVSDKIIETSEHYFSKYDGITYANAMGSSKTVYSDPFKEVVYGYSLDTPTVFYKPHAAHSSLTYLSALKNEPGIYLTNDTFTSDSLRPEEIVKYLVIRTTTTMNTWSQDPTITLTLNRKKQYANSDKFYSDSKKFYLSAKSSAENMVPFNNGKIDVFYFFTKESDELRVGDFNNITLSVDFPVVDEMCEFSSIQILINGKELFSQFSKDITLDHYNQNFNLNIPIPYYRIIGGKITAKDSNSDSSKEVFMSQWGQKTDKMVTIPIGRNYGWSNNYKENSLLITYFNLQLSTEANTRNTPALIGGMQEAYDKKSEGKMYIQTTWGKYKGAAENISQGYGWRPIEPNDSYVYTKGNLPKTVMKDSEPKIAGFFRLANTNDSSKQMIPEGQWGYVTEDKVNFSANYGPSKPYGKDSFINLQFCVFKS